MTYIESTRATAATSIGKSNRTAVELFRNPLTSVSSVILAIFIFVAIAAPVLAPFPPLQVILSLTNAPPFTTEYVLGGDKYGRDILSLLIASTTGALQAAVVLAVVATSIGVSAGLVAGYFGKAFDSVSTWAFSVFMAVPGIIVLISLYTLLGATTTTAMIVFGILISPSMFLLVRTLTRGVRNELYVDAAKVAGLSTLRIVGRHVLVAIRAPVILMVATLAGAGIAVQAGLEFLGLGTPGTPSWGAMLTDAFENVYIAPVQLVWPAAALGLVTGAFTLISIGLRDVFEGTPAHRVNRPTRRRTEPVSVAPAEDGVAQPLLSIRDLCISYRKGDDERVVVDGLSLSIDDGEIVGVVGESGSGKTQMVFAAMGLLPGAATVPRGSIRMRGKELVGLADSRMTAIRGSEIGYVPQEPLANLDPTYTVGAQTVFAIRAHSSRSRSDARDLTLSMFERVGIRDPARVFDSYPHEISGGMAQRVLIAGAVCNKPRLLLADEPTTALDVTVQAEVLDLLRDLQQETGMGVLIVTHDFGVVADLCSRVVVMREGRVVEEGDVMSVFRSPQNSYTQELLDCVLDENESPGERHG